MNLRQFPETTANGRVRRWRAIPALALMMGLSLTALSLGGCSTVNTGLANGMGDYIPQWAGGLPPDAPPRPGTPAYDAYMQERERQRLEPKPKDAPKDDSAPAQPNPFGTR